MSFEVAVLLFVGGSIIAVLVASSKDWSPSDLPIGLLKVLVWPIWYVVLAVGALPAFVLAGIWDVIVKSEDSSGRRRY